MLSNISQGRLVQFSERTTKIILRVLSLIIFVAIWEMLAVYLDSLLFPRFSETISALISLLGDPELWGALWLSNQAMIMGFLLAAVVGILLGLLIGRWKAAERFVDPYLNILLATPKTALIPIFIMAIGIGLLSRVLVTFTFAITVITVNVRAGLHTTNSAWVDMARSFGATRRQLWFKILLPGAFPGVVTGLRLGLTRAVSGMISVELLLVALGIGRLILYYQDTFNVPKLYATIIVVIAESLLLISLCKWIDRRLMFWRGEGITK